jgi:GT2 family glycosyltransferase
MDELLKRLFEEHKGKVSDKWLLYIREWDRLLASYQDKPIRLLEIGIQNGGSLEIWEKYFSNAEKIIGCDIEPKCGQLRYESSKIAVVVGDANADSCQGDILKLSPTFDVIIDDGSHKSSDIIRSFARYFPYLNDGGIYIVEDLHCSYWAIFEGGLYNPLSAISFFKRLTDIINFEHWRNNESRASLLYRFIKRFNLHVSEFDLMRVHSVEFVNSLCVIKKMPPDRNLLGLRVVTGLDENITSDWLKRNGTSIHDILIGNNQEVSLDAFDLIESVSDKDQKINQQAELIQTLFSKQKEQEIYIKSLSEQIDGKIEVIQTLSSKIAQKSKEFCELSIQNQDQTQTIKRLLAQVVELERSLTEITQSRTWRLALWMRKIRHFLIPRDSLRTQMAKKGVSLFLYPFNFWKGLKIKQELTIISSSELFNAHWYLEHNPDVAYDGIDPAQHYLLFGGFEGRDPSPYFSNKDYLLANPDCKINPLLHHIKSGYKTSKVSWQVGGADGVQIDKRNEDFSEILNLLRSEPCVPKLDVQSPIDILIPVYNGFEYLMPLFDSITKNTSIPYRLLIANDKSPDARVGKFLAEFKKNHKDNLEIVIIENEENLGFVKTVNKLAELTQNHFVLLNTDTEVPPHWLERLMYPIFTMEKIASVTPFTNAGTICSFPNFVQDNLIFENLQVDVLDAYFQFVDFEKNFVEIPTGVGFCMGINKNVYAKIGMFDEVFGKGYGEENDWCMRASGVGYKNIMAPNLFVYHKHGGSFPNEEKKKLLDSNLKLLQDKHPDYFSLVARFVEKDPLKDLRRLLIVKILSSLYKPSLVIDHSLGGGANLYTEKTTAEEDVIALLTYDIWNKRHHIKFYGRKIEDISFFISDIRVIEKLAAHFNIKQIIVSELVTHPKVMGLLKILTDLKKANPQIVFKFLAHDFFCVCPMYNLLSLGVEFCGVPTNLDYCNNCLRKNSLYKSQIPFVPDDYPDLKIDLWREKFYLLLSQCSTIVCFSHDSKTHIQKAYPDLPNDKYEIVLHKVDWVRPVVIQKTTQTTNIAVLGNMTIHKGAHIVSSLATCIDYYGLDIKVHIFGNVLEPYESFDYINAIIKHERYEKTDLPSLMEKNEIDLVLIPSIWPETFSYTAEEAMKMQLPIAVLDIGAPAERAKLYDKGIVLEHKEPKYILEKISTFLNKDVNFESHKKENVVFVCVSNNDLTYSRSILTSAYMTEYRIEKIDNRIENLAIPKRYNDAIKQLLASNYKGWVFFVHNDFSILEPLEPILANLKHDFIYGPIGAILQNGKSVLYGQILQGHQERLIKHGNRIDEPVLVNTVDCQCLFLHSDLLRDYNFIFDENPALAFHQYTEDFCLNANYNYGVKTFAVQLQCKHLSWGKLDTGFKTAIDYINSKYPGQEWAGTCTHL